MAELSNVYLTEAGQALLEKVTAGTVDLDFTKVCASSRVYAESALESLSELSEIKQTNSITKTTVSGSKVKVEAAFCNKELTSGYYIRAVGLYAADPDDGEILYAVCVETTGTLYMPAYDGVTPYSAYVQLNTSIGDTNSGSVTIYTGGFATLDDIETLQNNIAELQALIGYTDTDIYGVEVDFVNKTFTRLAGAADLSGGSDFDGIHCFGDRKRCNLTLGGVVVAYYGDSAFTTSGALTKAVTTGGVTYPVGTLVQTMVEQPKFYYKVVPLELEQIDEGDNKGYHARKIRYYISETPKSGFKLHPAFICDGVENDFIYLSAFEGSLYDVSASAYITNDSQVADFDVDYLASIGGVKPVSGDSQELTRSNARKLAENMGSGWELAYAATVSASQLLMLIEYAMFDMQTAIGDGITEKDDDYADATGTTATLGNATGAIANSDGNIAVSYRGEENFWGNIWGFVDGINNYRATTSKAGEHGSLFVADHGFVDNTSDSPYEDTGIHPYCGSGYVSAFGYNEDFDWLFIPTEVKGNSSLPVGDYFWNGATGWRVALLGGDCDYGSTAGAFYWYLHCNSGNYYCGVGGRSVYVPSQNN